MAMCRPLGTRRLAVGRRQWLAVVVLLAVLVVVAAAAGGRHVGCLEGGKREERWEEEERGEERGEDFGADEAAGGVVGSDTLDAGLENEWRSLRARRGGDDAAAVCAAAIAILGDDDDDDGCALSAVVDTASEYSWPVCFSVWSSSLLPRCLPGPVPGPLPPPPQGHSSSLFPMVFEEEEVDEESPTMFHGESVDCANGSSSP